MSKGTDVAALVDELESVVQPQSQMQRPQQGQLSTPAPGSAAYRRCLAWDRLREQTLQRVRDERQQERDRECTFQPRVSPFRDTSASSRSRSGPQQRNPSVHVDPQQESISDTQLNAAPIEFRLQELGRRHEDELEQKRKLKAEAEERECTFQPQVRHHPIHDSLQQHHLEQMTESRIAFESRPRPESVEPECTFHPQIGPKSRLIYQTSRLEEGQIDVFSRLYQRRGPKRCHHPTSDTETSTGANSSQHEANPLPEGLVEELAMLRRSLGTTNHPENPMQSFLENVLGAEAVANRQPLLTSYCPAAGFDETTVLDQSPIAADGAHSAELPPGSSVELMNFQEFLSRQADKEKLRRENRQRLSKMYTPDHTPSLCDESLRIARAKGVRSISSRDRRADEAARKQQLMDCSEEMNQLFKPTISKPGANCAARGPDEMYKDSQRRQRLVEEMRKAADKKKMSEATFRPGTNTNYPAVESVLANNLERYNDHLTAKRQRQQELAEKEKSRRSEEEVASCSFKPKTNEAPSYIHRMAHSVSVLRESSQLSM